MQKNTPYQLVPLVNFLVTTCPVWNIEDHEEKFVKLSCHSTCNGWIDVLLLFDKIFPRKFPRKVTVMYWRHLCEFKTLPTYYILFLSVLWKNILCLDQEEKWKRKKSNQVKTNIIFCLFLDITIMISTLSQAWITTYLICVSHSRKQNLKTRKKEENYSCEKIRTLKYGFCNKSFRKDEPLTSSTLLQHICPHFWAWLLLYWAITPKSEDKYVVKVFNWSESHLSEMT